MFAIQVSCSKMSWSRGQVTLPDSRRTFLERWQICHFRVAQKKIMHGWSDVDGVPCVLVLRQGCFQSERMWSLLWHNESFLFIYISPICSCRIWISAVWRGFCLYLGLQKQLFIKQLYILYLTTGIHWFTGNFFVFSLELVCECIPTNKELFMDYDSGCMPYIQYRAPTQWQYNWWC